MQTPNGLVCVFLGSDGSGKGAIVDKMLADNTKFSVDKITLHWRPGVLPPLRRLINPKRNIKEDTINPRSEKHKNQNEIISFARWFYYLIDYLVGYYLKIVPAKKKGTFILFDRYYYDYFVDPIRYGFNLPICIFKLVLFLVPKPDLTIYLDNEPEELYKRKQELPVKELERQVKAWREFIPSLPNAQIVTTDKPLEDVVHEVTKLVLERRAEMTRKMLRIEPEASRYLWKSKITDYIALPSKTNCRWIIPTNPRLSEKVWGLYQPYSLKGTIYKNYQKYLGRISPFKTKKTIFFHNLNSDDSQVLYDKLKEILGTDDIIMAVSTGTPSPFRKITGLVISSAGKIEACVKIGETPLAIGRIKNEAKMLKVMGDRSVVMGHGDKDYGVRIKVPELLYEGEIEKAYLIVQTPPPFEGKSGIAEFNNNYADVLNSLIKTTVTKKKFIDSEFYRKLKKDIDEYPLSYKDILKEGIKYLEKSIGDKEITFSLSHGDFAPWNMLWNKKGKEVFIFDWESASLEAPAGIDFFHFLFQIGLLLKKFEEKKLLSSVLNNPWFLVLEKKLGVDLPNPRDLLLFYLLKKAVEEDKEQLLSKCAVERRKLIREIIRGRNT